MSYSAFINQYSAIIVRRFLHICLLLFLAVSLQAQDSLRLYADTFKLHEQVNHMSDDRLLLYLVQQQGIQLAKKDSLAFAKRLETDTTTAYPFHVGLRDSLIIAERVKAMNGAHPLTLPLMYVPEKRSVTESPDSACTIANIRRNARRYVSATHPELYKSVYDHNRLKDLDYRPQAAVQEIEVEKALVWDPEEDRISKLRAIRNQFTPWRKEATIMLQLTQNYVSKNWYQGGNSSFAVISIAQGYINYDDKNRITWENSGEWRYGFNTVSADTLRKINANEDVFKLYSKLGIKIVNKLSYSVSADFQTHFFNTWKENTKQLKTGPLTPVRLNIATGLDYKPVEGLSLYFAPLSYRLVAVTDTIHAAQTNYSIPNGKKALNELGSSFRVEWIWKPVREISLETKFYFYTNYRRVEIDWETTCNFIINRFISARIMLHPRYDNTVILPDDERAKIQFKELISIGFAHKFR